MPHGGVNTGVGFISGFQPGEQNSQFGRRATSQTRPLATIKGSKRREGLLGRARTRNKIPAVGEVTEQQGRGCSLAMTLGQAQGLINKLAMGR